MALEMFDATSDTIHVRAYQGNAIKIFSSFSSYFLIPSKRFSPKYRENYRNFFKNISGTLKLLEKEELDYIKILETHNFVFKYDIYLILNT